VVEERVPSAARRLVLLLAVLPGCSPSSPVTTSGSGGTTGAEASSSSSTTDEPSVDETGTSSGGCVDGMPGCPCTPEGGCDEGSACAEGECVPLTDACGDGIVDPGEDCDDGNLTDADGCNTDCRPSGSLRWMVEDQPPEGEDSCAYATAIDSGDAIGVVGHESRDDLALGEVVWVTKLDPGGTPQWDDPSQESGRALAITVDEDDRLIVTGTFGISWDESFARIYESDGMIVGTTTPGLDWANAVAVTNLGEILVAGGSELEAYDDGPGWMLAVEGYALALAASPRGGFVVAGRLSDGAFDDAWAAWYGGPGDPAWTHVSTDSPYDDVVHGAALDGEGNVLLAGFVVQGGSRDVWLRKLAPDGTMLWTRSYNSDGTQGDEGHAVAVDSHDRIVVVGYQGRVGSDPTEDIWIRKHDPEGEPLWTVTHAGAADDSDFAYGVAIDSMDEVVVVGCVGIGGNVGWDRHAWIAKYSP
jgi:cysteine-rich repeat protein